MANQKQKKKTIIHAVKYANGAVVAETDYDRNLLKGLPVGSAVKSGDKIRL
ncbi:DUF1367 family protein [Rodentibacter genomosp. 2]|uniref:DUF1367 family protein n=1 Tax=Rodentibacter genomosp. 2 TaxID=1908266 RepID=UPI00211821FC|nr:DUF1367 family protein [Rodentibacter genomosp. 2]